MAWVEMLRREAGRWAGRGLDLLYPPRCALCGVDLADQDGGWDEAVDPGVLTACRACARPLAADLPRCLRCGQPCPEGSGCERCRGRRSDWDGIVVLGGYGDELRDAVLRAKRPAGDAVAAALGELLVRRHRDTLAAWRIDAVVPVPMHWLRRAARGASAADAIARRVAAALQVPCVSMLRRSRATPMQNELPFEERRGNVRGAFRPLRSAAGRRLLLVDDVVTTGGTLAECRRTLVAAGAPAVFAAAAARAERGTETRLDDG
jgi:ComF family protein